MPIYEYECEGCGELFEVLQKHSDPPPKKHDCGSAHVRRVMSRTSFVLKGTGWYATDYGNKGKKDKGQKDKESESSSTSKDSAGSEKTPNEKKTEKKN